MDDRWSQWTAWDGWPGSLHLGSLMVTDGWWMLLDVNVTVFNPTQTGGLIFHISHISFDTDVLDLFFWVFLDVSYRNHVRIPWCWTCHG